MQVTKFSTTQFGAIRGVNLDFGPELNVILGPNESGKSTVVNAISAALFRPAALDMRSTASRDFLAQFLPYPDGSSCDGRITFQVESRTYSLHRKWGEGATTDLVLPDGTRIEGEEGIERVLDSIFVLGRGTYERVVFARQKELKDVLETLRDDEMIDSIGSLLRKAVMQLDGVSIDKLAAALDRETKELLARWDSDRNGPEGNRGLSNRWRSGVGSVLKAWYDKEALGQEIARAEQLEQEISIKRGDLTDLQARARKLELEVKELAGLEGDVFRRAGIEPKLDELQKQSAALKTVVLEWPQKSKEVHELKTKLSSMRADKEDLDGELDAHGAFIRKQELEKLTQQVLDRGQRLGDLQAQLASLPSVTEDAVMELAKLEKDIIMAQAAIQAGTLLAKVSLKSAIPVHVTRDLEGEALLEGSEAQAQGYLKLRLGEIAQVEIRAGEQDFVEIKQRYQGAKARLTEILGQYGLESTGEAQAIRSQIQQLTRDESSLKEGIAELLDGRSREDITQQLTALADTVQPRNKEIIQQQRLQLEQDIVDVSTRINMLTTVLEEWGKDYDDSGKAMDILAEIMGDIKQSKKELDALKPLPEQFASAQDFSDHLRELRRSQEEIIRQVGEDKQQLFALEREMPQVSLAEMQDSYGNLAENYENLCHRAQKLRQIKQAFAETVAEMDKDSFGPLARSFSRYLSSITLGAYKLGGIDDKLNLALVNKKDRSIPINLLSSGTYDSTALSLRFALLEHVFGEKGGMVVLDDCLVDLDPHRKEQAIAIIREYAVSNQVIFTTCNPETAKELGGTLIVLK